MLYMARFFSVIVLLLSSMALNASTQFPYPPELKPDVDFWIKVYTQVDTNSGYLHDARDLSVIYEELRFPPASSSAQREQLISQAKKRYEEALRAAASKRPSALNEEAVRRVKAVWPNGSAAAFTHASQNVRFQLGQSDRFKAGLVRSGLWRNHIREVLKQHGLPQELEVLPHVESSFNPSAYSKVAAAGMWQFMPGTARQFMQVDHIIDERMDPFASTVAAARLLKSNYQTTGTWPLALTAYNHGAGGIRRASELMGTKDIAKLVRNYKGPAFGFASRNFYVSFLATLEVDRNSQKYFGPVTLAKPVEYETVALPAYLPVASVANAIGANVEALRQHNPSWLPTIWSGEKYIPKGVVLRYPKAQLHQPLSHLIAAIPSTRHFAFQQPDVVHRIVSGESLSQIARRYDVRVSTLMALNGITDAHSIRAGRELKLPGKPVSDKTSSQVAVQTYTPTNNAAPSSLYVVKPGDSLWKISRLSNISQAQLLAANDHKISAQNLRPGQKIKLPVASVGKSQTHTYYVIQPGDSLWNIAKRYNLSVKQLVSWNNLIKNQPIMPGDSLRVAVN